MDSYSGLLAAVIFCVIVGLLTHLLGGRLRENFPALPVWRGTLWYRWKSLPSEEARKFSLFTGINFPHSFHLRAKSAWLGFLLHFIFLTVMIIWAQFHFSGRHAHNCPTPSAPDWCGWTNELEPIHFVFLAGTGVFILLHLLQTHYKYDGIAQDSPQLVPIIGTVLSLCVLALMQQTERGLVFGYGLEDETFVALTNIARRFHPYVVGWVIVFTFWFHPMEGGLHHLPGLLPLMCTMIQGCLLFSSAHLNPLWRVGLELLGFPHAIYIEWSHPDRGRWKMFLTGVLLTPLVVHFHIFKISVALTTTLLLCYVTLFLFLYRNMPWRKWSEPLHFPATIFFLIFIIYGIIYIPYKVTNLLGIWPVGTPPGTIPSGFDPAVWFCGVFLVFSIIILTFVLADLFEGIARSFAAKVGPMSPEVARVFKMQGDPKLENVRLGDLPLVTMEEVSKHNKKEDAWVVIDSCVYDVTKFINYHPGTRAILLEQCGKDGTDAFNGIRWGEGHPLETIADMEQLMCARI